MTETTSEIFEKYQVRKTKKQKVAFREYIRGITENEGYSYKEEKGYCGAKNIVIGDPDNAKVIYTAHYDTCARLPFPNFITPKSIGIYLLYQLLQIIVLAIIGLIGAYCIGFCIGIICGLLNVDPPMFLVIAIGEIPLLVALALMLFGPANKNTANDNTSGVTLLVDIMLALPKEDRENVAFVFFDLEETGLWGSAGFASKHKKVMKETLIVNYDCVSDGDNILLVLPKKMEKSIFEEAYEADENVRVEILNKGVFYPSDQANFKRGVGVAALKKAKKSDLLYMDKIHTNKDTAYREENIEFLKNASLKLAKKNIKKFLKKY